ncbi:hypothetical protein BKA69DRAFT_892294 [Paraphysoderma sedebokerense]|nr:hypothetical protein BKA69DRAFT_892294 [Paraphysoderma sedebokerense]
MLVSGIDTKMVGSGSSVSTSANNQDVRAAEQLTKAQSYKELFDSFDSSSLNPNFDDFMPEKFPHFMNKESGNGTEPPVDPLKRTKFQSADEVGKVEEDIPEEIIEQNSDRSMGKDDQKSVARVTSNALNTNAPVTSSNDTDNYEDDFASYTEDSSYSSRNQATDHKPSQESSTVSETRDDLSEIVEDIPENEDVVVSKVKVSPSASLLAQSLETSNGRSSTSSSLKNSMTLTAIPENAVFQSNALPSSDQPMSRERSVPSSLETSNTSNSSKDSERTRNIDLSKRFVIDEAELLDVDSYPTFRITDVQSILVPELEPETSKPYTTVDHQVEPDNKDQIKTTDHDGEFGLKLNHELKSTAMNTSLLEVVVHSHDEIIQYVQSPLEASQISVQTLASSLDEDELLEKQGIDYLTLLILYILISTGVIIISFCISIF